MHEGLADAINQIISTCRVTQHPKHSRSHWPPLTLSCLEKDVQMREETCLMVELVDSLNKFLLGHIKLSSMPSLKLSEGKLVQVESVTHKTRHLSRCLRVRSPLPGCCTRSQYRALLISIAAKRGHSLRITMRDVPPKECMDWRSPGITANKPHDAKLDLER